MLHSGMKAVRVKQQVGPICQHITHSRTHLVCLRVLRCGHPHAPGGVDLIHGLLDLVGGLDVGNERMQDQKAITCGGTQPHTSVGLNGNQFTGRTSLGPQHPRPTQNIQMYQVYQQEVCTAFSQTCHTWCPTRHGLGQLVLDRVGNLLL